MLRKDGDLVGLPIVEVSGHTQNAINCGNAHLTFEDLLKLSIGVDGCNKPAIRVKYIDSCDALVNCTTNVDQNPLNKMFAYDSSAKTYAIVINKSV